MFALTLMSKNFMQPMIIAIAGIVPNFMIYHWDHLYLSPWAIPECIVLIMAGYIDSSLYYPLISLSAYTLFFSMGLFFYFNKMDVTI